jgi:hypothetical protein
MGAGDHDLYLGERAWEPLLRRAGLDVTRAIEFATHGLMSGGLKGSAEPALVWTPPPEASPDNDGLLIASKIATLKLNAEWMVLSACIPPLPTAHPTLTACPGWPRVLLRRRPAVAGVTLVGAVAGEPSS